MNKTIVIAGYGPGVSDSVAKRFTRVGYSVVLIARNQERLDKAVTKFQAQGVNARAFAVDLRNISALNKALETARSECGPIEILHWNAFMSTQGDLLEANTETLRESLDVRLISFIAAIQQCLPDLKANKGAVLATSGIMSFDVDSINAFAKDFSILAISVAAQHKAIRLLTHTLSRHNVFMGEVIVNGFIQGSEGAEGHDAIINPDDVAEAFWKLASERSEQMVVLGNGVPLK